MIQLRPENVEDVYNTFEESIKLRGNKSSAIALVYYMQSAINMMKADKSDESIIFDAFESGHEIDVKN